MYKLLLCWRYLRTRYIALACIVSVMLGVATMIVVNAVMSGFSHEMGSHYNGMLGDLVLESHSLDGVADSDAHMAKIREVAGNDIVGMSPIITVPSLLYLTVTDNIGQQHILTRQVMLFGIDEATYADVSEFGDFLQHPANREQLRFTLRNGGYDVYDHRAEGGDQTPTRPPMESAGWPHRQFQAKLSKQRQAREEAFRATINQPALEQEQSPETRNPFAQTGDLSESEGRVFDAAMEQHPGIVLNISLCSVRDPDDMYRFWALPGDDVRVSFPKATMPAGIISDSYTVVDFYDCKMAESDTGFAFVPIHELQKSRGMFDPETGIGRFNSIQIKLRPGADLDQIRNLLQDNFSNQLYTVSTWRDKQGAIIAAVQMETIVLNILLFMIVAVAGFGILAIFFMIVVEKTRDIGILKSLGASSLGVMTIFLAYGLGLGLVGSGVGLAIGLTIVKYIQDIADLISWLFGIPIFDPSIYLFSTIPTIVEPWTVFFICFGAISISVLASVLPAFRAARLHPVRALRYE